MGVKILNCLKNIMTSVLREQSDVLSANENPHKRSSLLIKSCDLKSFSIENN